MSSVANASIDAIEKIKSENADLDYILNELRSAAWSVITQLKSECESKLKEYDEMANEAIEVATKARNSEDSPSKSGVVAQAEKLIKYYQTQYKNIQQMIKTLDGLESSLFPLIDNALTMVQSANGSLQTAINAVNEYISYSLKQ